MKFIDFVSAADLLLALAYLLSKIKSKKKVFFRVEDFPLHFFLFLFLPMNPLRKDH